MNILSILVIPVIAITSGAYGEVRLHENKLGTMVLSHGMNIDLASLRAKFKMLKIIRKKGQQDGPDFIYYQFYKNKKEYFSMKARDDNEKKLDQINISSRNISDQYNVSIGISYIKLKKLRPKIQLTNGAHYHTYVYVRGSNISYEISGDFQGPDRDDFKESEVLNWKVSQIIWMKPRNSK